MTKKIRTPRRPSETGARRQDGPCSRRQAYAGHGPATTIATGTARKPGELLHTIFIYLVLPPLKTLLCVASSIGEKNI